MHVQGFLSQHPKDASLDPNPAPINADVKLLETMPVPNAPARETNTQSAMAQNDHGKKTMEANCTKGALHASSILIPATQACHCWLCELWPPQLSRYRQRGTGCVLRVRSMPYRHIPRTCAYCMASALGVMARSTKPSHRTAEATFNRRCWN